MLIEQEPYLSVVIPFYNEEKCIKSVCEELIGALDSHLDGPYEMILVNDGSTDDTAIVIEQFAASDKRCRAVHLNSNCGQSAALSAGFAVARGEIIGTLDGDGQNDPMDFIYLIAELKKRKVDMMCGVRTGRCDTLLRKISSKVANRIRSMVLQDNVTDIGCAIRVFKRSCLDRVYFFRNAHRFFPALLKMHGYSVSEMPVNHRPRLKGISKYGFGINTRLWVGIADLLGTWWLKQRTFSYTMTISRDLNNDR